MKALQFIKSVAIGALKATPIGNIIDEVKANKEDTITGKGVINYPRLAGYLIVALLLTALVFGKLTFEDFEKLFKLFLKHLL
jgi:hypothetical protein